MQPRILELYNLLRVCPDIVNSSRFYHALAYYDLSLGKEPLRLLESIPMTPTSDIPFVSIIFTFMTLSNALSSAKSRDDRSGQQ